MILADTSVWIDYFHDGPTADAMELLLANDILCVNDVILAELLPQMIHRREQELIDILLALPKMQMNVDWDKIIAMQTENIRHGLNKVGIPDLMIAQNVIQSNAKLFTIDKHFALMSEFQGLSLFVPSENGIKNNGL
ncbi:MAG: PIN domain-containing protein [Spirochaetaceae bacterium]|nr:PIN domain-containing protein [Spirochaetaceae bacterium]